MKYDATRQHSTENSTLRHYYVIQALCAFGQIPMTSLGPLLISYSSLSE